MESLPAILQTWRRRAASVTFFGVAVTVT